MLAAAFLVIPAEDGEQMMRWLFPGVKKDEPEGTLGNDHKACAINATNVWGQLSSIWFLAHAVGWWAKMLMLRDLKTCIVYSTVFELTELTLQFWIPEFQECWWDSMIMDWLIANTLIGMMLGRKTLSIMSVSEFNWAPRRGFGLQALWKLAPGSMIPYEWNPANDPITLALNAFIWIVMAVGEVNSFFLINILGLPRDHTFNSARQALLCLCAVPAVEEWYEYTRHVRARNLRTLGEDWFEFLQQYTDAKGNIRPPRLGQFTWLLSITVCIETAAVIKYSVAKGILKSKTPGPEIWHPWAAFFALFGLYFVIHCYLFYRQERKYPLWLRVLKWGSCLPLLGLLRLYAFCDHTTLKNC
jgi:hypothetical protein